MTLSSDRLEHLELLSKMNKGMGMARDIHQLRAVILKIIVQDMSNAEYELRDFEEGLSSICPRVTIDKHWYMKFHE